MPIPNFYTFKNFLRLTEGKVETGLIIAQDNAELMEFLTTLKSEGYKESENIRDLILNKKTFFHLTLDTSETSLKYIKEYATGSIGLASKKTDKFQWHYPDYENSQLLVICTEDELRDLHKKYPMLNIYNYATTVFRTIEVNAK